MIARMISDLLRVPPGPVDLTSYDTNGQPGFEGDKDDGKTALEELGDEIADLQERLFAQGTTGRRTSVLLVLQGMDTSGKGGVVRKAAGLVDPQGLKITSFKAPTAEELGHDFLWRVNRELPGTGKIGIFDRSHYEDVLVARVRGLVPMERIERRYDAINAFEERLVHEGTVVVKCMLHISSDTQEERLLERLDNPDKHWKFNPGDVDERALWPTYQRAYEIALERCNTEAAPWHVVPSDRKWYRNWAVAMILLETLRGMELGWPAADFDVDVQRQRLQELEL